MKTLLVSFFWLVSTAVVLAQPGAEAPTKVEELQDAPPLTSGVGVKHGKVSDSLNDDTSAAQLLVLGVRADLAFSAGRPTDQGFSIPGLRVNVSGEIARCLDYKVAIAPTRELSSVLLPQLLPAEVSVQFRDAGRNSWKSDAHFLWKLGLFAPSVNPLFTPDLGELPMPSYSRTHQATLLFRELGSEWMLRPVPGLLDLSGGVFNGNGTLALNTNNAKAFTGSAVLHLTLGDVALRLGLGGQSVRQADPTSVNFVNNLIGTVFAVAQVGERTWLSVDVVSGKLQDSSRAEAVLGVTGVGYIGLTSWISAYLRAETLRYSPSIDPRVNRFQIGPAVDPTRGLRVFAFYEHLDNGTSASESSGQILVRVSL